MIQDIKFNIEEFKNINNVHQYRLLLDTADLFIKHFPLGASTEEELDLGIVLLRELINISMISSLHQYEYNYDLQNEILRKKIKVFKLCIPVSHMKLRGLTELMLGMKENAIG